MYGGFYPLGKTGLQLPQLYIGGNTFFEYGGVVINKLTGEKDKPFFSIAGKSSVPLVQKLREFSGKAFSRPVGKTAAQVVGNARFCGIADDKP